jgi:probable HAF family extracellular repeat protein
LPGGSSSTARAISANGMIAGESNLGSGSSNNVPAQYNGGATQLPNLAGADNTYIRGINNAGVAAAVVQINSGDDRAALLSSGGAVQLAGISGFNAAGAFDINNNGIAAGYVLSSGATNAAGPVPLVGNGQGVQKAVIWSGGVASLLASPTDAVNTMAFAINDNGTVVGMYRTTTNQVRGVMWVGGVPMALASPVAQLNVNTRAISETGWVAGQSASTFGTVWTPTGAILLPQITTGAFVQDTTRGINSAGTVVGFNIVSDIDGNAISQAAMLWDYAGGSYTGYDLSTLVDNLGTWNLGNGAPQAINDKGDIVGFAGNPAFGAQHAYLLTAVPEPASWALMVAGFGLMGGALRRRQMAVA